MEICIIFNVIKYEFGRRVVLIKYKSRKSVDFTGYFNIFGCDFMTDLR